jgi:UDP-N-acetylglucosamine transferase subunit ALG13
MRRPSSPGDGMTTLLVASTGGHLKQLHRWRPHLEEAAGPCTWVTFDTPQSRSLLAEECTDFVDVIVSRDLRGAIRAIGQAAHIIRRRSVSSVISTGSAIAVPYLLVGRLLGLRCIYIESAARSEGPSLTGRMVAAIPGVALYTQYPAWPSRRWSYRGSIFDDFVAESTGERPQIRRVVVTLGTLDFDFSRLLRRLVEILPPGADVLWQCGCSDLSDLGIAGTPVLPEAVLAAAMRASDVVVSHAGVGSAITALEAGKRPVLVARSSAFGEHVDDHQSQIAADLERRGLATDARPETLTLRVLEEAAAFAVKPASTHER